MEKVIKVNGIKDYARLNLKHLILAAALILAGCVSCKESCSEEVHIKVNRIWDSEKHCAFTSLTRFGGRYYVAFREAGSHIFEADGSARGQIRILESRNGRIWKPVACLSKEGYDLRDPSLSVTPDGRFEQIAVLPSGGDTSYPGFLVVGDELWVSYYSSHATPKAAVYLARIPLKTRTIRNSVSSSAE